MFRSRFYIAVVTAVFFVSFTTSCSTRHSRDLGTHDRPLDVTKKERQADVELLASLQSKQNQSASINIIPSKTYRLAELIDIAQQRNPATRQAWLKMREAGRQASIVESALLPFIAATAAAGGQKFSNTIDLPLLGSRDIDNSSSGAVAAVTANWLIFDFGENAARRRVASELQRISGFAFNRLHQQLVYDVAFAFHSRNAALQKQLYAAQAIKNASLLLQAAEKRRKAGVGTKVEVAQARQLLAQTRLTERVAIGEANTAAVSLAASLSLSPTTQIDIQANKTRLPRAGDRKMEKVIDAAFTTRPDVLSTLAQVRAAQKNLDATAASYLPKVMLAGIFATGDASLDVNGFSPNMIGPTRGSGGLIGASVPLYDGNLRRQRMANVRDRLSAARDGVDVAKSAASREIAMAYESLRTALAINHASQELVSAATTTANAAQEAYEKGVGTIIDASLATMSLYTAKEAQVDARRLAQQAAITLALATGKN